VQAVVQSSLHALARSNLIDLHSSILLKLQLPSHFGPQHFYILAPSGQRKRDRSNTASGRAAQSIRAPRRLQLPADTPPSQNSCRPNSTKKLGAAMKVESGSIRTSKQEQGRGMFAAAQDRVT
jgi:hypothetical protein